MDKNIFREKNVENMSSPDNLNDYIRVVKPSLWVTLAAIIVLLAGIVVWSAVGRLDTVIKAVVVSENGSVTAYINESDSEYVLGVNDITVNGFSYKYNPASSTAVKLDGETDLTILTMLGDKGDARARCFTVDGNVPEGVYRATILVDSVKPMSFVID